MTAHAPARTARSAFSRARTADDHRDRPTPRILQREAKLTGVDRSAVVVE
jgi:hypothetical protein